MKILITGSHFTPAQAVIERLKKQKNVEIVYVGRKSTREGDKTPSIESQVLPALGVKFIPIISGRLQRAFTIYTIPSLLKIPIGFLQSFIIILKEKPDIVLSFGGYVALPVIFSSWVLSIPIIVHEQTLVSGLANTISAWFADKIAISFAKNTSFNKSKTILTGNPLREELLNIKKGKASAEFEDIISLAKEKHLPLVLITGGNQGSHIINESVGQVLHNLTRYACVIHQTGDSKFQDFEKLSELRLNLKYPQRYLLVKWIKGEDMGIVLKKVDLAVSRAGINTLVELAFFGIPALVIPLPYLYKDEQNVNARFFAELGLIKILPQKDLSGYSLLQNIKNMIRNLNGLKENAKGAKSVVIEDAAERLALETLLLGKTKVV